MKISMVSLGCPKNQVDAELMLGLITEAGHELSSEPLHADVIVINTCGFINDAKEESINKIIEMAEYKKSGRCKHLIVTGCLAQRYPDEILSEIPETDIVLGTAAYDEIIQAINVANKNVRHSKIKPELDIGWMNHKRILSTQKGTAYLKISEGCNNRCTYCIIPSLRGPFISRPIESLIAEVSTLVEVGVKEIILVGQDVTNYGKDLYNEIKLVELINRISEVEEIKWIRLMYCYPELVDDSLIHAFQTNPKLCRYIDIPMQHSSDQILRRMGRRTNRTELIQLLNKLHHIENICIRSTFIVGFPGETVEDFQDLKEFLSENQIDNVGVFVYSREEGTPAYTFQNQIPENIKLDRYNEIKQFYLEKSYNLMSKYLGQTIEVLVENVSEDGIFYYGRTAFQAPEIDGVTYFTSQWPLEAGTFVSVKVLNIDQIDLIGEVTHEPSQ